MFIRIYFILSLYRLSINNLLSSESGDLSFDLSSGILSTFDSDILSSRYARCGESFPRYNTVRPLDGTSRASLHGGDLFTSRFASKTWPRRHRRRPRSSLFLNRFLFPWHGKKRAASIFNGAEKLLFALARRLPPVRGERNAARPGTEGKSPRSAVTEELLSVTATLFPFFFARPASATSGPVDRSPPPPSPLCALPGRFVYGIDPSSRL